MKGKFLFLVPPALLGILFSFYGASFFLFAGLFFSFFLLSIFKRFSLNDILLFCFVFIVFLASGMYAVTGNHSILKASQKGFILDFKEGASIDGDSFKAIAVEANSREKLSIVYRIKTEKEKKLLEQADFYRRRCGVKGILKQPSSARNPNAFDYKAYLEQNQVFWILELSSPPLNRCSLSKKKLFLGLLPLRSSQLKILSDSLPSETSSVASALIFGDQSNIPEKEAEAYKKLGITHLLAISGMQVTMLASILLLAGIRAGMTREKILFLLLMLLPAYAVLAGGTPSVNRAVIMSEVLFVGNLHSRKIPILPVDALSIAFLAYIFLKPYSLYDPGFQLSFAVTLGILLSVRPLKEKRMGAIGAMLGISMISQLSALPIVLAQFDGVPLISVAANLLFIPLYTFFFVPAVYVMYLFCVLSEGPPLFLSSLVNDAVIVSNRVAVSFSKIDFKAETGEMGTWAIAIYTVAVVLVLVLWEIRKMGRRAFTLLFIPLILVYLQSKILPDVSRSGEITLIDVGQGDSILISLPHGDGNYLIDTGGTMEFQKKEWQRRSAVYDPGKETVVPFLRSKGIGKLDKLVLTHGDIDHIGGALAVIREIKIGEILIPAVKEKSEFEKEVMKIAEKQDIKIRAVSRGDRWEAGDNSFYILTPVKGYGGERNGGSISVYTKVGGLHWLFTGDLDEEGEKSIIEHYPSIKVDVLKAGHHGSRTSSSMAFLQSYKPKTVLISAGMNNRFGHPHQETLDRFKKIKAAIFRTDQQGAVTYRFHGETGTFSVALPYNEATIRK